MGQSPDVTFGVSSESGNSTISDFSLRPPNSEMVSLRGLILRSLGSLLEAMSLYPKYHNFLTGLKTLDSP